MDADRNAEGIALWWNAKLSGFRKKHSLTIEELARLLPAKTELVAAWENGKERPPLFLKRALRELEQELISKSSESRPTKPITSKIH